MDSPILPERDEDDEVEEHRRYRRCTDLLRLVAAGLAVTVSLIGLASRLHHAQGSRIPSPAIQGYDGQTVVYGDLASPAALKPGKTNDPARAVCDDEIRYEPTSGHWYCVGDVTLGDKDVGRVPKDPGGPCTHRWAGAYSPVWKCVATREIPLAARIPGPPPGDHGRIFGGMRDGSDFCSEEARASATHGAWTCTHWRPIPRGFRFIEATATPGPCAFRAADQQTGEWTCNPPVPGL